jgi:hypothetical protein
MNVSWKMDKGKITKVISITFPIEVFLNLLVDSFYQACSRVIELPCHFLLDGMASA